MYIILISFFTGLLIMWLIVKLFILHITATYKKDESFNKPIVELKKEPEWIEFSEKKPPNEVVLAALDTYDCGWCIDTAWWSETKQCWMTTGTVENTEAYLPYTHWRTLPDFPR